MNQTVFRMRLETITSEDLPDEDQDTETEVPPPRPPPRYKRKVKLREGFN